MVNFLKISDPEYPSSLRNIYKPPQKLYYKGDVSILGKNLVAFVGTRKNTPYGRVITARLIEDLSLCDLVIVSGLARGIDTIAHESALRNGLKTVAVLGTGIENIYPAENADLARRILEDGGCLLSEYGCEAPKGKFAFPMRNRVIAGLCFATVVVEAPKSSGALITAKRANEENREVFAVPGDIDRPESAGCNSLIQQLTAKPALSGIDIIRELKIQPMLFSKRDRAESGDDTKSVLNDFGESVAKVFDSIPKTRPVNIDQIMEKIGIGLRDVNKALSLLEIHGLIIGNDNGFYVKIAP